MKAPEMPVLKLARPNEVSLLRMAGYRYCGPSPWNPGFIIMERRAEPDEAEYVREAVACLEGGEA